MYNYGFRSHPEICVPGVNRNYGFPESPGTTGSRSQTELRVSGVDRNSSRSQAELRFTYSTGNPGSCGNLEVHVPGVTHRTTGCRGHTEIRVPASHAEFWFPGLNRNTYRSHQKSGFSESPGTPRSWSQTEPRVPGVEWDYSLKYPNSGFP